MRILLLQLPSAGRFWEYSISSHEHLGLGYLSSLLREHGNEVYVVLCDAYELSENDVYDICRKLNPEIVGISIQYVEDLEKHISLISPIRDAVDTGTHISIGGHAVTCNYDKILRRCDSIDSIVIGEGELTFLELVKQISRKGNWHEINGIAFNCEGKVRVTPRANLIPDLDGLPFPHRDAIKHLYEVNKPITEIYLSGSRGCFHNCSFCDIKSFYSSSYGQSWRGRSAKNIVDEIKLLIKQFGTFSSYCFVDDQFIGPGEKGHAKAKEFVYEILKRKIDISFEITCRADSIKEDIFRLLKRAGLKSVYIGIDSAVNRALKTFNKKLEPRDNIKAMSTLSELGIIFDIGFIMYDPWITAEELMENVRFLNNAIRYGLQIHPGILMNALSIYPGTKLFTVFNSIGKNSDVNLSDYYLVDKRSWLIHNIMAQLWNKVGQDMSANDESFLEIGKYLLIQMEVLIEDIVNKFPYRSLKAVTHERLLYLIENYVSMLYFRFPQLRKGHCYDMAQEKL